MSPWYAEKIGPLPIGAWAGVVATGLGIGYYERRHAKTPSPDPTQAPTYAVPPDATVGGGAGGGGSYGGPDPGSSPPPSSGGSGGVMVSIQTNEQWGSEATRQLIVRGTPALLADLAVRSYLEGANLTAQQDAIVTQALQILGPPPVPPPLPLPNIPPPEPPAPQPPPPNPYPPSTTPAQPPDNSPIAPQPAPAPPPPSEPPPAPPAPPTAPQSCASLSPGPASFGYLQKGSRGQLVAQAQDALRAHGHDPGPSDGIFGSHTEAAVRAEQAACGVQVDGIIGRQTACCLGMG